MPIQSALGDYPICAERTRLIAERDNDVYRVWTANESYSVRHHRRNVVADDVASELAWLEHLAGAMGSRVPLPLRRTDGGFTSHADGRVVSVLHWVSGRTVRIPTEHLSREIGRTLGELHCLNASFSAPPGFSLKRLDTTCFFGPDWMRRLERARSLMDADAWALVRRRAEAVQAQFPAEPAGVLHNDLNGSNCLWQRGTLAVIDFASVGVGPLALDLAVALRHLPPKFRPLLISGYRSVYPLSAAQERSLPMLIQARMLSMVTYAAERLEHRGGAYDPVKLVAFALESLRREPELAA